MDYKRVYADFIEDRRGKTIPDGDYSERHHIVPKCLFGSDDPDNLINLTPEDHFFAHLLLAKIHGGVLWAPVAFMVDGQRKDYKPTHSRKRYGWVRRALARSKRGANSYQFDFTVYHLVNAEGREWSGRQSQFPEVGISRSLGNMLVKGRLKSAKGWWFKGRPEPTTRGAAHPRYKNSVYEFEHIDGRVFTGTQFELHTTHGVARPATSLLARGKVIVWNGWHLRGAVLPTTGRGKKWRNLVESKKTSTG